MAVISYEDVATAIGRPISDDDERDQVEQWIADVELLIGARTGDIDDLNQDLLIYVIREVVIARMRYRSEDATGEDGTGGEDGYLLRVLNPWWSLLDPGETGSGAFSVRPYFETDYTCPIEWV